MCRPSSHIFFMECAIHEAKKSVMEQRHGAVIVKNNKIIASGHNCYTQHFKQSWSTHAEVSAILQLSKKPRNFLKDCDMYVVRLGTKGMGYPLKLSKPCPCCKATINAMGIKRVYYSINDEILQCNSCCTKMKLYHHSNNHPMQ